MKLSHKLVMVSAAALMGVSPVVGSAVNTNVAFAATKKSKSVKVYNTMGKHSRIKPTKTMYFVNNNGKTLGLWSNATASDNRCFIPKDKCFALFCF